MAQTDNKAPACWHHAPLHSLGSNGVYMVTCGTLHKKAILTTSERLDAFQRLLFKYADKFGWRLQAWAILNNHYHWVACSPSNENGAQSLKNMASQIHEVSAKQLNKADRTPGRKVWFNFWDSHITYETSYFARLKYVHDNPVHHGVIDKASNYRWCSRSWLEMNSKQAFVHKLDSFKTDQLNVADDF